MSDIFVEQRKREKDVQLRCGCFTTICPYNHEPDHAESVEIIYEPITEHLIDDKNLKEFLYRLDEKKAEIPMEVVPLKILIDCMVNNKEWLREGKKKTIQVKATFAKKSGAKMVIKMKFEREWVNS